MQLLTVVEEVTDDGPLCVGQQLERSIRTEGNRNKHSQNIQN